MSTESLNRTSEVTETPSQYVDTQKRVNVDVLKQRLFEEKKREKEKEVGTCSRPPWNQGMLISWS